MRASHCAERRRPQSRPAIMILSHVSSIIFSPACCVQCANRRRFARRRLRRLTEKKTLLSRLAVTVGSLTSSLWAHSSFSLINYPPGWRGLGSLGAPPPSSQGCPSPEGRFFPPGSQPKAPFSHGGPQPRGAPPRHRGIRSGALPCDARAPRQLINYQHCPQLFLC